MSNVLTALTPVLFSAAQTVSAEPFGAVGAITTSFNDQGVAIGDQVTVPIAPAAAATDFTPSNVAPTGASNTASDVKVQITKSRRVSFHLTGEQQRSLDNGATSAEWVRQLTLQAMRRLRNEAEADCVEAIKIGASRAVGTAGTNPFGTNLNALADLRQILRDNGAPMADMSVVMDSASETAMLKLGIVASAEQAGSDQERRTGLLGRQYGFDLRTSAGIIPHVAGAGVGYDINVTGGEAIGDTAIILDGGTVNTTGIRAGDCVTFAGGSEVYVVNEGLTQAAGTIRIGRPGLRRAIADATEMTIGATYTPILGFERSAVVGVMRPPIFPANPTISQMLISDGLGMTYLMLDIAQYGQRTWEFHLAWGFRVVQSEHVAILRG